MGVGAVGRRREARRDTSGLPYARGGEAILLFTMTRVRMVFEIPRPNTKARVILVRFEIAPHTFIHARRFHCSAQHSLAAFFVAQKNTERPGRCRYLHNITYTASRYIRKTFVRSL